MEDTIQGNKAICGCGKCSEEYQHKSDCAVHNEPAYPNGKCDCRPLPGLQAPEVVKPDCSGHKKEVAGISDMKVLAEMIGDLHYETLVKLTEQLRAKLSRDAVVDQAAGRVQLAMALKAASEQMGIVRVYLFDALAISKPFMEPK